MAKGTRSLAKVMTPAFASLLLVLSGLLVTVGGCDAVQEPPAVTVAGAEPPENQGAMTSESSAPGQLGQPLDLLIVTPPELSAEAQKIADWKNSTGMRAGIITLTDVYEMCAGRDGPEKIQRCLSLYQQQSGMKYAMLFGDGDGFPVRFTAFVSGPAGARPCST